MLENFAAKIREERVEVKSQQSKLKKAPAPGDFYILLVIFEFCSSVLLQLKCATQPQLIVVLQPTK